MATETKHDTNKHWKKAKGRSELLRHLQGGKITRAEAIFAKCYDCMGNYADGLMDCEIDYCALYPYFPYKEKKEELV